MLGEFKFKKVLKTVLRWWVMSFSGSSPLIQSICPPGARPDPGTCRYLRVLGRVPVESASRHAGICTLSRSWTLIFSTFFLISGRVRAGAGVSACSGCFLCFPGWCYTTAAAAAPGSSMPHYNSSTAGTSRGCTAPPNMHLSKHDLDDAIVR